MIVASIQLKDKGFYPLSPSHIEYKTFVLFLCLKLNDSKTLLLTWK